MDLGLILILLIGGLGGGAMLSLGMAGRQIKTSQYPQEWSSGLSEADKKKAEEREKEHHRKKVGLRLVGALSSSDTEGEGTVSFPDAEDGAVSEVSPRARIEKNKTPD